MTATVGKRERAEALPADERRAMIIEAMLPLLLEHGEMVTTRLIAEAAGIAEGTIFRVFADKDELIAAVVEHATDPAPIERGVRRDRPRRARSRTPSPQAVRLLQRRTLVIARLMAAVGPRFHQRGPIPDRPASIALFEAHRDHITVEPAAAARWLAALTMSTSHPMISSELAAAGAHRRAVPPRRRQRGAAVLTTLLQHHLRPYRRLIVLIVVLQAVQTAAALTLPGLNADIIDNGVLTGDNALHLVARPR